VDLLNYGKDGSEYWLDFAITPIYDDAGKLIFFAAIERDVSEHKVMQEELYQLATTDSLTGVFNRRRFLENFEETLMRIQREKTPHALLIIDLDNFKKINDKNGHLAGDKILCDVAQLCQSTCRASDSICRYGGDEFLILLHNASNEAALQKATEICELIQKKLAAKVTVSIGVTLIKPADVSIDDAIKRADKALYYAKKKEKSTAYFV
jgi:diguanylate cyclase (GGDEF)-like protein